MWRPFGRPRGIAAGKSFRSITLAVAAAIITWQTVALVASIAGTDAHYYWLTPIDHPYAIPWGGAGAFPYSPAAVLALWPIQQLPQGVFVAGWMILNVALVGWLVGPRWAAVVLLGPTTHDSWNPVLSGLWWGNVPFLMAAAWAVLPRLPAAGAFLLLTKVTPGIPVAWFAFRRDWRNLAIALGVTAVVAFVSYLIAPQIWADWIALMVSQPAQPSTALPLPPVWLRTLIALGIVGWGALTNRPWTIAIAGFLAQPAIWPASIGVSLLALPRLLRAQPISR